MDDKTEMRVEKVLQTLTLEEKAAMCRQKTGCSSGGVARLGIGNLRMSDGPHGVGEAWRDIGAPDATSGGDEMTAMPVGICLAATWNPELAQEVGAVIGRECLARDKDVILGPAVNIRRTPLCGRNFEYFGEDPYLSGRLAVGWIRGVQSEQTSACTKHYACNNHEWGRTSVDVIVDERALREIYLPAFEDAVKDGGTMMIMGSYNKVRGQYCCHHDYLLKCILKQEWGFKGAVVSDWGGVHDTFEASECGLDIEMGGSSDPSKAHLGDAYLTGLKSGLYSIVELDEKVRRILRVMAMTGRLDGRRGPGSRNTTRHVEVARRVAREGIVLLKNDRAILPLVPARVRTLAVIGDNAAALHCRSGGSSSVRPNYEVTPLAALTKRLGGQVRIVHEQGYPDPSVELIDIPVEHLEAPGQMGAIRGWTMSWFGTRAGPFDGSSPVREEVVPTVRMVLPSAPDPRFEPRKYGIQWTATLKAPVSGEYEFILCGAECGLAIDGTYVFGSWDSDGTVGYSTGRRRLEAGHVYNLRVNSFPGVSGVSVRLGWRLPGSTERQGEMARRAINAAREADMVLFVGGLMHGWDTEGNDLPRMELPFGQDSLIESLVEVNRNVVVALMGSGATAMRWIDRVQAVLQTWYGGMEAGNALVDVLTGDVNPSGRLPITMYRKLDDCGAHALGDYDDRRVVYREGIFVGYRWVDRNGIAPLFPFGHGLSYTQFEYSNLTVQGDGAQVASGEAVKVSFEVRNAGSRAGAEVAQVYVRDSECSVPRPVRELKRFEKVELAPGGDRTVTVELDARAFSFWHPILRRWTVEPGEFVIEVGASSRDIRLSGSMRTL